jgi:hypothetical protein
MKLEDKYRLEDVKIDVKVGIDIWKLHDEDGYCVVVPTNIGWKKDGTNIMGAGLAKQAADRYPLLPEIYGKFCKANKENTGPYILVRQENLSMSLILLPTKKLNIAQPHLSWTNRSDPDFIDHQLKLLKEKLKGKEFEKIKIAFPLLGSGNGRLPQKKSMNLIKKHFYDDERVCICIR